MRHLPLLVLISTCVVSGCDLFGAEDDPLLTSTPPWRTEALNPNPVAGEQTIAVIMARSSNMGHFENSASSYRNLLFGPDNSVNAYVSELSGGLVSVTGDVFGPYELPEAFSCSGSRNDANEALRTAMIEAADADLDFTQYGRIMFILPDYRTFPCLFSERHSTRPVPLTTSDGLVEATLMQIGESGSAQDADDFQRRAIVHRYSKQVLGSFGIGPADGYLCVDGEHTRPNNCMLESSLLPWVMFGSTLSQSDPALLTREWLGWVPESDILTATESATYVLRPANEPGSGAVALRIPLNSPLSIDTSSPTGTVHVNEIYAEYRYFSPSTNGVLMYTYSERDRRTEVFGVEERELVIVGFDTHPTHKPTDGFLDWREDFEDSPLREGDRFDVGVDGIRIEVVALDENGTAHVRVRR